MAASKFLIKQETSLTNCANNEKEHTKGIPKGRFFWFVFYAMILVLALKHAEGMSLRLVGNYAPFWCRNHCSLLLPLCVRNLLRRNHKRPSPRLNTGVGHCHQAALIRSCGASFACMVFRMIRHLRCLCLVFRVFQAFQVFRVFQVFQVFQVF